MVGDTVILVLIYNSESNKQVKLSRVSLNYKNTLAENKRHNNLLQFCVQKFSPLRGCWFLFDIFKVSMRKIGKYLSSSEHKRL